MKWYIVQRTVWSGFAAMLILTITFILLDLVPDQRLLQAEWQAAQAGVEDLEAVVEAEEERLGIAAPLHERYIDFVVNFFQGNWGWSTQYDMPVWDVILQSLPYSIMYGLPSIVLSTVLGVVIGLYSAINQYTKTDYAATFVAFFGVSIPNWWFGILLLVFFGTFLGWVEIGFNPHYATNTDGRFVFLDQATDDHPAFFEESFEGTQYVGILSPNNIQQLILPIFVSMTGGIAAMMRYARAEALEYVDAEFVKTAKSKGVSSWRIVAQHIFRPAAVPLSTIFVGRFLAIFLSGSYLIEVVFGIPGIGEAAFEAIVSQDQDLVMVTLLLPTFFVLVGNLAQDIMYVVLDPRIDYGDRA